ncbi:cytochrome P450 [Meredithblackwellia eburnea MCA 4105]
MPTKKNHQNFIRGAFTRHALGQMQRTGIFVSDGQAHHFQRKSASKAFSRKNFESHITAVVQHHLKIMLSLLGKLADSGTPFDFQDLMARFTVCAILKIAFHDDTGTDTILSDDPSCLKGNAEFILAFDEAQALLDQRRRNPMWQVTEYLSGKKKITDRAISLIYGFLDPIIQRRLETPSKMEESGKVDLLDLFIQSTTDRYTLGGMCLGFLLAGRDTTAFGTAWMFGEILHLKNKHLNLQQRVQDELAIREGRGFLEYGDTNKLKLLNALWDESARLNTVSPAGQLEVAEDDCLPAVPELGLPPRPIKKGDLVGYQNYVLHRMPQIWGDDAEEFKPERWFDPDGNYISHGPFKYHSWNAGPRSCLGRALATFEGIATAVAILSNFELELQDPSSPMEPQAGMNMGIAGGLWMTAHRRVDAEFDA